MNVLTAIIAASAALSVAMTSVEVRSVEASPVAAVSTSR